MRRELPFSGWGVAMEPADAANQSNISRYLSLVLRHEPQSIGLALDAQGWASIDELIDRASAHGVRLTHELVRHVAERSDKQRFTCDGLGRIRANHGHTVPVDLGIEPSEPPPILFHGTAITSIASIMSAGLIPGMRQYVHLSVDT